LAYAETVRNSGQLGAIGYDNYNYTTVALSPSGSYISIQQLSTKAQNVIANFSPQDRIVLGAGNAVCLIGKQSYTNSR
jgi:hypothetical protein